MIDHKEISKIPVTTHEDMRVIYVIEVFLRPDEVEDDEPSGWMPDVTDSSFVSREDAEDVLSCSVANGYLPEEIRIVEYVPRFVLERR